MTDMLDRMAAEMEAAAQAPPKRDALDRLADEMRTAAPRMDIIPADQANLLTAKRPTGPAPSVTMPMAPAPTMPTAEQARMGVDANNVPVWQPHTAPVATPQVARDGNGNPIGPPKVGVGEALANKFTRNPAVAVPIMSGAVDMANTANLMDAVNVVRMREEMNAPGWKGWDNEFSSKYGDTIARLPELVKFSVAEKTPQATGVKGFMQKVVGGLSPNPKPPTGSEELRDYVVGAEAFANRRISDFITDAYNRDIRGETLPASIISGVVDIVPYMGEFMLSGPLTSAAKTSVNQAAMHLVKKYAKGLLTNYTGRLAARAGIAAGELVAQTAAMEATVGVPGVLSKAADYIANKPTGYDAAGKLTTVNGQPIGKAFLNAVGDSFAEYFSERTGQYIGMGLNTAGKALAAKAPEAARVLTKLRKSVQDALPANKRVGQAFKTMEWDGLVSELGEERVGDIIRAALDVNDQKFAAALFPGWDQLLTEAGVLAVPGVARTVANAASYRQQAPEAAPTAPVEQAPQPGQVISGPPQADVSGVQTGGFAPAATEVPTARVEAPRTAPPAPPAQDGQYEQAVAAVREANRGSTAVIQRKLGIGFVEARDLIERMLGDGVLGDVDASGQWWTVNPAASTKAPPAPEAPVAAPAAQAAPVAPTVAGKATVEAPAQAEAPAGVLADTATMTTPEELQQHIAGIPKDAAPDTEAAIRESARQEQFQLTREKDTPQYAGRMAHHNTLDVAVDAKENGGYLLVDVPTEILTPKSGHIDAPRQERMDEIGGSTDPIFVTGYGVGNKGKPVLDIQNGNNRVAYAKAHGQASVKAFVNLKALQEQADAGQQWAKNALARIAKPPVQLPTGEGMAPGAFAGEVQAGGFPRTGAEMPTGRVESPAPAARVNAEQAKGERKAVEPNLEREQLKSDPKVFWHGSPSGDLRGAKNGLHIGTYKAAQQALEARIGVPAEGEWDGTREYGKTKLAGKKTLRKKDPRGYLETGVNAEAPQEDYYPSGNATYSDQTPVAMDSKPNIVPVRITGKMTNTPSNPHGDFQANALMSGQIKKGKAKSGYYYEQVGEDAGSISAVVPSKSHIELVEPSTPPVPSESPAPPSANQAKAPAEAAPAAKLAPQEPAPAKAPEPQAKPPTDVTTMSPDELQAWLDKSAEEEVGTAAATTTTKKPATAADDADAALAELGDLLTTEGVVPAKPAVTAQKLIDQSYEKMAEFKADAQKAVNYRPGDEDVRRTDWLTNEAIRQAADLSEDDFARLMAFEGRKDMAQGNATKLIRRIVPDMTVAQAKNAAAKLEPTRFTRQHYSNTRNPELTGGVNVTATMVKAEDVYRAAHRELTALQKPAKPAYSLAPENKDVTGEFKGKGKQTEEPTPPVPTAPLTRQTFREKVKAAFKLDDAQTDAVDALTWAAARQWSARTGRRAEDWYAASIEDIDTNQPKGKTKLLSKGERRTAAVEFVDGGKALIHALEAPNVSSVVHELGHVWRRQLTDADMAIIAEWAGAKDGKWTREAEERFARGVERYLRDGKAPTPKLAKVFKQFKEWLRDIYKTVVGGPLNLRMSDEVRQVLDGLFAGPESAARRGESRLLAKMGDKAKAERRSLMQEIRQWYTHAIGHDPVAMLREGMPGEEDLGASASFRLDFPAEVKQLLADEMKAAGKSVTPKSLDAYAESKYGLRRNTGKASEAEEAISQAGGADRYLQAIRDRKDTDLRLFDRVLPDIEEFASMTADEAMYAKIARYQALRDQGADLLIDEAKAGTKLSPEPVFGPLPEVVDEAADIAADEAAFAAADPVDLFGNYSPRGDRAYQPGLGLKDGAVPVFGQHDEVPVKDELTDAVAAYFNEGGPTADPKDVLIALKAKLKGDADGLFNHPTTPLPELNEAIRKSKVAKGPGEVAVKQELVDSMIDHFNATKATDDPKAILSKLKKQDGYEALFNHPANPLPEIQEAVWRTTKGGSLLDNQAEPGGEGLLFQTAPKAREPKKTVKAYKLFRRDPKNPNQLLPLFVNATEPVPIGPWLEATAGPAATPGKVKSRLGLLAYRPGWHAGDLPIATHIGGKPDVHGRPTIRPAEHVWAEVELAADVDWQAEADRRAQRTKAGTVKPSTAAITDQVPSGGYYRFKTNPNMTGNWLIGGTMRVNRILTDDEVKSINDAAGVADLPRAEPDVLFQDESWSNPKIVAAANKALVKAISAGDRTFDAAITRMAKVLGEEATTKIAPIVERQWAKLHALDPTNIQAPGKVSETLKAAKESKNEQGDEGERTGPKGLPRPDDGGMERRDTGGTGGQVQPKLKTAREDKLPPLVGDQRVEKVVPADLREKMYPHQAEGVARAYRAMTSPVNRGFYLADGTGAGKTTQILGTAAVFARKGQAVLIIAPSEVLGKPFANKGQVSGSYADDGARLGVPFTLTKGETILEPGTVYLSTYEHLAKLTPRVGRHTVAIFDEAHYVKNLSSGTKRALEGDAIAQRADSVLYASATPADKPMHLLYMRQIGIEEGKGTAGMLTDLDMEERVYNAGKAMSARTIPAYLNIKSPIDLRRKAGSTQWESVVDDLVKEGMNERWLRNGTQHTWEMFDGRSGKAFVEAAKKAGYDGVIFEEEGRDGKEHTTYAVFESSQVKSAIGNQGTFDPTNPNILYQSAPGLPDATRRGAARMGLKLADEMFVDGTLTYDAWKAAFIEKLESLKTGLGSVANDLAPELWSDMRDGKLVHAGRSQLNPSVRQAMSPPPAVPVKPGRPTADFTTPEGDELTGIKNAFMDALMEETGNPPPRHGSTRKWDVPIDDAMAVLKADPKAGQTLMRSLSAAPRPMTDTDGAVLLIEATRIKNAKARAMDALIEARANKDDAGVTAAQANIDALRVEQADLADAVTVAGTRTAQGLAFRRAMMKDDFTLGSMEREAVVAAGGVPLTAAESAQLKELHARITEAMDKIDMLEAENRKLQQEAAAKAAHEAMKQQVKAEKAAKPVAMPMTERFAKAPAAVRARVAAAKATLAKFAPAERGPLNQTAEGRDILNQTSPDPEMMEALRALGMDVMQSGERTREAWDAAMVEEAGGEWIRPHLDAAWEAAREQYEADRTKKVKTTLSKAQEGMEEATVRAVARKLAREAIADGIEDRDAVTDEVTRIMQESDSDITRNDVAVAISGYGHQQPLRGGEVESRLRDIQGELRELLKMQDLNEGKAPLKSGPERQEMGDEQRRLVAEVNELKRRTQYAVTDPKRQLKGALDAIKTRMQNQIIDLEDQISAGQQRLPKKTKTEYDADAEALRQQLEKVKEQYNAVFNIPETGPKGMTDAQRAEAAQRMLEASIADLERQLAGGQPKPKGQPIVTPELKALRAKRDALKEELDALRNPPESEDDIALRQRKAHLLNEIAKLLDLQARDQWQPKEKPRPGKTDSEEAFVAAALEMQKQRYYEWLFKRRLDHEAKWQRAGRWFLKASGATRAFKSALDLSYVLRQAGPSFLQAPVTTAKTILPALKAMRSEANRQAVEAEIKARPSYALMKQAGLELTARGKGLAGMEETYQSEWAEKIPGVAASERGFSAGLNRVRADLFDLLVWRLETAESRNITIDEAKSLATWVNNSTGRVGAKSWGRNLIVGLNQVIWSTQLQLSRIRMLTGSSMWTASPAARKLIAKQYLRGLASVGAVIAAGMMLGGEWEKDPRSGSFGKLRFGKLRLDVFAGIPQYIALLVRTVGGWQKNATGAIVPTRGDVPFGQRDAWDIMTAFARSKTAPIPGAVVDLIQGKNVVGEPVTPWDLWKLPLPLSPADIAGVAKEYGIPAAMITTPLVLLGIGTQIYNAPTDIGPFQTELYRLERMEKKAKADKVDMPEFDARRLATLRKGKAAISKVSKRDAAMMEGEGADAETIRTRPPTEKAVQIARDALSGKSAISDKSWNEHQRSTASTKFYAAVDAEDHAAAVKYVQARHDLGVSLGDMRDAVKAKYRAVRDKALEGEFGPVPARLKGQGFEMDRLEWAATLPEVRAAGKARAFALAAIQAAQKESGMSE